jgi:hypothetical protein
MAQLLRDHGMLDGDWIELTVMPGGSLWAFSGPDGGEIMIIFILIRRLVRYLRRLKGRR